MKKIHEDSIQLESKMAKAMSLEEQLKQEEKVVMEKGYEIKRVGDLILNKLDTVLQSQTFA